MSLPSPVLKYPGAKWRLSEWIIPQMPAHTSYVELFCGSAAVFFRKPPSRIETLNDIDQNVTNFFKVLREHKDELAQAVYFTPWSRDEYEGVMTWSSERDYMRKTGDPVEDARRFLVRLWQGHGSKTSDRTSWRYDIHCRNGSCPKEWLRLPKVISLAAERLKEAQIENRPALDVLARYAFHDVLIYADPPYPLSTRSRRLYANEMSNEDHKELLVALDNHPGPVLLSSYPNELYDQQLQHWTRKTKKTLAEGGKTREEVLWLNPIAARAISQTLF